MNDKEYYENQRKEIFTRTLRAGKRSYFFDVEQTKSGDYYLTITESKKEFNLDGDSSFKRRKLYLYKRDFNLFKELLEEATKFIIDEKGEFIDRKYELVDNKHDNNTEKEDFYNVELKFEDL